MESKKSKNMLKSPSVSSIPAKNTLQSPRKSKGEQGAGPGQANWRATGKDSKSKKDEPNIRLGAQTPKTPGKKKDP